MKTKNRSNFAANGLFHQLTFSFMLGTVLTAFSLSSMATPMTSAEANASTQWRPSFFETGENKNDTQSAGSAVGAVSAVTARADVQSSRNLATATAGLGYVKAGVFAHEVNPFSLATGATAKFSDDLALSAAGVDGQMGQITVAFYFDYSWDVSGYPDNGGYSNASLLINGNVGNQTAQLRDYEMDGYRYERTTSLNDANGDRRVDGNPGNWMFLKYDYRWGSVFSIGMEMQLVAAMSTPDSRGTFGYEVDGTHSGYWGGIVSATAGGIDINDYRINSASGVDYSQSFVPQAQVPEPTTFALLIAASLALLLTSRGHRESKQFRRPKAHSVKASLG